MKNRKLFLIVAVVFSGLLFLNVSSVQACSCSSTPCTAAEDNLGSDPITGASCPSDESYCCERKTSYAECDPVGNVSTDGKACSGGTCQNGKCIETPKVTAGCCVINSGNCLDTDGTAGPSCSVGTFFPKSCSQLATYCESNASTSDGGFGVLPPSDKKGVLPPNDKTTPSQKFNGLGIEIPSNTGLPDPADGMVTIIRNLLTWLLGIVGVIALIGFIVSGIQYLTAAGNEDQMQSAKRNLLYSVIGVVVVLASFVIIQAIDFALRAQPF